MVAEHGEGIVGYGWMKPDGDDAEDGPPPVAELGDG